jgi:hypothetical protein
MKNVMLHNLMFDCCDSLVFAMMFVLFDDLIFWLVCENLRFGASAFAFPVWT